MPTRALSNRCRQLRSVLRLDRIDLRPGRTAALVLGLILSLAFVSATVAQETPIAPPEEETPAGAAPLFGCEDTARRISGEAGAMQTVFCSAGCAESLWGTDVYTDDSSVCTAARHAGVIAETGGFVTVTVVEGQETYTGSVQNGVESWDYGSWDRSFSVAPAEELLVLFDCDAAGEDIAGEPGTTLVGACPPGCSGSLWGRTSTRMTPACVLPPNTRASWRSRGP
ncbi:MAG: LCCL domain-containing protein [Anaerolineae bacterium]|nr:LCCL domain-containing protein [Anaerolineae bacterium]